MLPLAGAGCGRGLAGRPWVSVRLCTAAEVPRSCVEEACGAQGTLQLPGVPIGNDIPQDTLQVGHLGYGPQKVHCTKVRYVR